MVEASDILLKNRTHTRYTKPFMGAIRLILVAFGVTVTTGADAADAKKAKRLLRVGARLAISYRLTKNGALLKRHRSRQLPTN
jgi:hypothetical protein